MLAPIFFVIAFLSPRSVSGSLCLTSSQGTSLIGYIFTSLPNMDIYQCFQHCKREPKCQSLNYYISSNTCQLSNRTIAHRPGDARQDSDVVYFENPFKIPLGAVSAMPALSCSEIKQASSTWLSGIYWLVNASSVMQGYCNLTTGLIETCTGSPCQHGGTCHYHGLGNYKCTCNIGFTGANCETEMDECYTYATLTDASRNIYRASPQQLCDSGLGKKWYRFSGAAGTRIATSCPQKNICNTAAPGWLNAYHPSVADGVVSRKVCFHWNSNCCHYEIQIRIKNCGDRFFVYEFPNPPTCNLRYCSQ
ncbi:uromodulin [Nematostella vectensis]|uniref:uromodulin n=1 Tax=Nematostella vectensis TaxID=45351 RepID=UPI0020776800|nr:uromodulin [Nematostella vectensis]